jgi:hypothetical protein
MIDEPETSMRMTSMPTRRQTLLSALTAALWQVLPRGARAADKPFAAFNGAFGAKTAAAFLAEFEKATAGLSTAAVAFVKKPGADTFAGVLQGFGAASDAWMAVQVLRFGPMTQNQRLDRIAYWPERSNMTEKQMAVFLSAADKAKLAPASFATASVAIQGLSGLERLLFDNGKSADNKPVSDKALAQLTAQTPAAAYRAALIAAIAANLHAIAKEGGKAWHDLSAKLAKGDQGGFAASPQEATNQIYAGLVTGIQMVSGQKIGIPLGKSADTAKPHQAEQWRSGRSLHDIQQNIVALRQALLGDPAGSVIALVAADAAPDLRAKITAALDACDQAIPTVTQPLDIAVADDAAGRPQVQALLVKINQLRDVLTNDLPKAAGITLGFNDLDGDGG